MSKENRIEESSLKEAYLEKGKSIRAIARELGRGEATILRYLRLYKIERRPQHQMLGKRLSTETRELIGKSHLGKKVID